MADRKPPRLAGDELATMLALLQFQRESLVRKVDGVSEDGAMWSPVPSGTTLRWLVEHLTRAESVWVEQRFGGMAATRFADAPSLDEAVARYREQWARTDAIAHASALDATCAADEVEPPVSLRWVLAHLLEETARHTGHADVLRELLDGQTGR